MARGELGFAIAAKMGNNHGRGIKYKRTRLQCITTCTQLRHYLSSSSAGNCNDVVNVGIIEGVLSTY